MPRKKKENNQFTALDDIDISLLEKFNADNEIPEWEQLEENFMTDEDYSIYARCREIIEYFRDNVFPVAFDIIKQKKLFNADIRRKLDKAWLEYKSAEIYPLILPIHDTYCSSLHDSNLKPRVIPVSDKDIETADIWEKYLNRAIDISDKGNVEKVWNEAALLWDSYCMPWFSVEQVSSEDENGNGQRYNILLPKIFPVSKFEVFYSIWARSFETAPEKIRRRFVSYSSLLDVYAPIADEIEETFQKNPNLENAVLTQPTYISRADFTKIYDIDKMSIDIIQGIIWKDGKDLWVAYENAFNILLTNDYGECIELYTQGKMILFFNGYKIYDWVSPFYYEDNEELSIEWPLIWIYYEDTIWTKPMWIGQKLMPHQKKCNQLWNTISDGMYQNLNPMYWVVRWALVWQDGNAPSIITYEEWKCFNVEPWYANGWVSSLNFIDPNVLSLAISYLNNIKEDAYAIIGVNSYTLWWQGKIERTGVAVNQRVEATRARLAPIIKSIGRAYRKLFYHWINLWIKNGVDNAVVKLTDNDVDWYDFEMIDLKQLNKDFSIICSAESQEESLRQSKSEWIIRVLNSLAPYTQSVYTGMPIYNTDEAVAEAVRTIGIKWLRPMSVDETKKKIDDALEIQQYQQEQTQKMQQEAQEQAMQEQQQAMQSWEQIPMEQPMEQIPQDAMMQQMLEQQMQWQPMQQPIDVNNLTPEMIPEWWMYLQ